jgi:cytochrome c
MKRLPKLIAIGLVLIVPLVGAVAVAAHVLSERKAHRKVDVKINALATENASIEQGKYLFESRGCLECHGAGGKGRELINDPNGLYVRTPPFATGLNRMGSHCSSCQVKTIAASPTRTPHRLLRTYAV